MKPLLFIALLTAGLTSEAAVIPSPCYTAQPGTAVLTTKQRLVGRFYYHMAPFSKAVSFYYHATGPASQRIISVADIQTLTVGSRRDPAQHRTFQRRNSQLVYQPRPGSVQEITRALCTY